MEKQFLTAQDIAEMCSVSTSTGYKMIRALNEELLAKGYMTIRGRVPARYLLERVYGAGGDAK